jgi:hypothetical protein
LNNKFLQQRMNALALKRRIRTHLCQRKFELDGLERAYRHATSANKLRAHAEGQMKRKEPGIQQLRRTYNELCEDLESMIAHGTAPQGAVAPHTIEKEGLFKLDVDDEIWQDIGLVDFEGQIPRWLGDDKVRQGIKSSLELDRCEEEERRLCKERQAIQDWMVEEWHCVDAAIKTSVDDNMTYLLKLHAEYLAQLVSIWQPKVILIPAGNDEPGSWGPSAAELVEIRHYQFYASITNGDGDDEWPDDDEGDNEEGILLEEIQESELGPEPLWEN